MNNTEYSELTKGQPLWWRCLYPLLNISLTVLVAIMTYEIIKVNNINYYLKAFIVILYLIMFSIRLMFSIVIIMLMTTKVKIFGDCFNYTQREERIKNGHKNR